MATRTQRARAILDALADTTVSDELATRVADGFVYEYARGQELTAAQRAGLVIQHIRNFVKERVRNAEIAAAVETARQTAAGSAEIEIGDDGSE